MVSDSTTYFYCKEQLSFAVMAIHRSVEEVNRLLEEKKILALDCSDPAEDGIVFEVNFTSATSHLLFDDFYRCDTVFVLLNEGTPIQDYISFCIRSYGYDFLLPGWVSNDCIIQIHKENGSHNLLVTSLQDASLSRS